jgi:hypothetical protein
MQQLAEPALQPPVAEVRLGRLPPSGLAGLDVSLLALQYAARWRNGQPGETSRRLYRFNSVPRNPAHRRLLGRSCHRPAAPHRGRWRGPGRTGRRVPAGRWREWELAVSLA